MSKIRTKEETLEEATFDVMSQKDPGELIEQVSQTLKKIEWNRGIITKDKVEKASEKVSIARNKRKRSTSKFSTRPKRAKKRALKRKSPSKGSVIKKRANLE